MSIVFSFFGMWAVFSPYMISICRGRNVVRSEPVLFWSMMASFASLLIFTVYSNFVQRIDETFIGVVVALLISVLGAAFGFSPERRAIGNE